MQPDGPLSCCLAQKYHSILSSSIRRNAGRSLLCLVLVFIEHVGNKEGVSCIFVEAQWSLRSLQRTGWHKTVGDLHFLASEQVTVPEGILETTGRWWALALDGFPVLPSHHLYFLNSQWFWAFSLGLAVREMCWGWCCGSCISFLCTTSRVALGAFSATVGEMAVTILSCAEPHCPPCPWQAFLVFVPLSPDETAGHSAQCLTRPWSLSCFLIPGPGLSCFAFTSSCSSLQYINHIFMQYVLI